MIQRLKHFLMGATETLAPERTTVTPGRLPDINWGNYEQPKSGPVEADLSLKGGLKETRGQMSLLGVPKMRSEKRT